jgi:hypothetical protein
MSLHRKSRRDHGPAAAWSLNHKHPQTHAADQTVAPREEARPRPLIHVMLAQNRAIPVHNGPEELRMFRGIWLRKASAQNGDSSPPRRQRCSVHASVYAASATRDERHARSRQMPGEPLGHGPPGVRAPPRTDNGHIWTTTQRALHPQQCGGIWYFQQQRWHFGIIRPQIPAAQQSQAVFFVSSGLRRI